MFENKRVRVVRLDKPHIQFIEGWWRVSPLARLWINGQKARQLSMAAHRFAGDRNSAIVSKIAVKGTLC